MSLCNYKKYEKGFLFGLLFLFVFASTFWTLNPNNHLIMDDYTILFSAMKTPYKDLMYFLPKFRYNDRSFVVLFDKVLYDAFGLNNMAFHFVLFAIHFLNVFLVYKCVRMAFKSENSFYVAIAAAGIFGIYPKSIMAVSWVSAVPDLLCGTFVFLSIYCFLSYLEKPQKVFYGIHCLLYYIISLRFKEMSLALPLFFIIYDFINTKSQKAKWRFNVITFLPTVWMLVYTARLFSFPAMQGNEYEQSFNPIILFKNFMKYLGIYTDLKSSDFSYAGLNPIMVAGILLFIIMSILILIKMIRDKKYEVVPWALGVGILLAPVLTMPRMQHKLYLYIPSLFIAVCIVYTVFYVLKRFTKKRCFECTLLMLICLVLCNYTPGIKAHKDFWIDMGIRDQSAIQQVESLTKLLPDSTVYVKGASNGYNIINPYGPGNILKLIYKDPTIDTVLVTEFPSDPKLPYVFWQYENGSFYEMKSEMVQ